MNNNIDTQNWKKKLSENPDAICIDVRTPNEYNEYHISNAINIDIYDPQGFMKKINEFDLSKSSNLETQSLFRSNDFGVMIINGFLKSLCICLLNT